MSSLRSMAVRRSGVLLSGEAAKTLDVLAVSLPSPARVYDFAHPTKTAMLRRLTDVG